MGMKPAKTYIFPPAAAPRISSAGSGNGGSFSHLACAKEAGAAASKESIATANCNPIKTIFLKVMIDPRIFGCAVLYNGGARVASFSSSRAAPISLCAVSPQRLGGQDFPQPDFDDEHRVFGNHAGQALFAICQMRTDPDFTISSRLHAHQTALDAGNNLSFSKGGCMIHQLFPGYAPDPLFRHMLRLDCVEWNLIAAIEPYLHVENNAVTSCWEGPARQFPLKE